MLLLIFIFLYFSFKFFFLLTTMFLFLVCISALVFSISSEMTLTASCANKPYSFGSSLWCRRFYMHTQNIYGFFGVKSLHVNLFVIEREKRFFCVNDETIMLHSFFAWTTNKTKKKLSKKSFYIECAVGSFDCNFHSSDIPQFFSLVRVFCFNISILWAWLVNAIYIGFLWIAIEVSSKKNCFCAHTQSEKRQNIERKKKWRWQKRNLNWLYKNNGQTVETPLPSNHLYEHIVPRNKWSNKPKIRIKSDRTKNNLKTAKSSLQQQTVKNH